MARLLDPLALGRFPFIYVNAAQTDIRATFDRIAPGWNKKPQPKLPENVSTMGTTKRKP